MSELEELLKKEEIRLTAIEENARKRLENVPDGHLRLSACNGQVQYYHCTDGGKKNGSYIPKGQSRLARELAQKDYDQEVLECAQKRRKQIQRITRDYRSDEIEKIYLEQHEERKKLILPIEKTREQIIKEWLEESYTGKDFEEGAPVILTERGERVRSKSEKIIADFLFQNSIPYKYEHPIRLKGFGIVYPDFTVLSMRKKQEFYWEHLGKMDEPLYAQSAVKKINCYEENGIRIGDNLILTFETAKTVLNTKTLHNIADQYL